MRRAAWLLLGLVVWAGAARAEESALAAAAPSGKGDAADQSAAQAPEKGAVIEKVLKAIKADGPLALPDVAQSDLLAMMSTRRADECAEPPKVTAAAFGLKDRGDGPALIARVSTCKGGTTTPSPCRARASSTCAAASARRISRSRSRWRRTAASCACSCAATTASPGRRRAA